MFQIAVWKKTYNEVHALGKYLKDSRHDSEGKPPKYRITLEETLEIEKQIEDLLLQSTAYLDKCGIRATPPKWPYDAKDEATWVSSEKFIYGHLI